MTDVNSQSDPLLDLLRGVDFAGQMSALRAQHEQEMRGLLLGFLEIVDAVDRMLLHDADNPRLAPLRRQLDAAFARAGAVFTPGVGTPFDASRHCAVEARPGNEPDLILEELQRGCEWRGTVLRYAQVVISSSCSQT